MTRRAGGYVLLEAIGAMVVLSVGIVAINEATREIMLTRAQARDFTRAGFLLEELMSGLQLRPQLTEGTFQGKYGENVPRFRWKYVVSTVQIGGEEQVPQFAVGPDGRPIAVELPVKYMVRIVGTVSWTLKGQEYFRSTQTLCQPEKLPKPDELAM
jgi:hypothetical protein